MLLQTDHGVVNYAQHLKVSDTVIGTSPRKFLDIMIFPFRSMMNIAEATIVSNPNPNTQRC